MVRIPFLSKSADRESLARCLDLAAERSGVGADAAVQVMSLFFEAVADELTKGRVVRVPGFGIFVPAPIPERHRRASRNPTPRCKPYFSPSQPSSPVATSQETSCNCNKCHQQATPI